MVVEVMRPSPEALPQIEALRDEYFASRNAPVQTLSDDVWWMVGTVDGTIEACQGYQEVPALGQRWIMATFCRPTRGGRLALANVARACHEAADREGVVLCGMTEPDNEANFHAMISRGWSVSGIMLSRLPKGAH